MLKFFFYLSITLICCNSYAQSSFGISGSINIAHQKINPTSANDYNSKSFIGYSIGLSYRTNISNKLAFVSEVNFTLIGAQNKYFTIDSILNLREEYFNDKAGYLELPLLLQYGIGKAYLTAGPALLVNLFAKTALLESGSPYKSTDWSANIGAGYRITNQWEVGIRYSHGLTDINDVPEVKADWRQRHARLAVRYSL